MVSSAYQRLLIFLPAILIPACASSIPTFFLMYFAYKLNKQGNDTALMYSFPNLEPVCCSMSGFNYCFLTCIQVTQEAGRVIWYSLLFKNFPVCCDPHSQKLWLVNKAAAAAAAAKSLQSCPTLCDPIDGSPPGSPVPWILQARTPEWVAISFSNE